MAATGPFQRPVIPAVAPTDAGLMQIHSSAYRNPDQLPKGAVLVVGAGSSGAQIAEELMRSGKQVFLSVGSHDRRRAAIVAVILSGGSGCWASGMMRRLRLAKSMSPSRSVGRAVVTRLILGALRMRDDACWPDQILQGWRGQFHA